MATSETSNNNTIQTADLLDLGTALSGTLTASDVDYFKVSGDDISVDSLVSVLFTPSTPGVGKEWTVDLVNGSGTSLLSGGAQDVTAAATLSARVASTAGSVYLKVSPSQYSGGMEYTVKATTAPAEEAEDNDSLAKATPLTKGVSVEGVLGELSDPDGSDVDYYLFTVADAGTVTLTFNSPTSTASSNIYTASVVDKDGAPVSYNGQVVSKSFGIQSTSASTTFAATAGETYFVKVAAATGEATGFNSADDDREAYTVEFSGSATLNSEPVVTIGAKSSSTRGVQVDSGVTQSVKLGTSIDIGDVVTVSDADGDSTISKIKFLLVDSVNAGTQTGGYITSGGSVKTPVSSSTGNAYYEATPAQWAEATYTAGSSSNTQVLYVYAVDDSGVSTDISGMALGSRVDTGGTIFMDLASVDADVIVKQNSALVSGGSTLGSVTEGDSSSAVYLDFTVEGDALDAGGTVSVTLASKSGSVATADLEFYDGATLLSSNLFTLSSANVSTAKRITVKAVDDGVADVEDLALSFTTTSAVSALNNITKELGTVAVAEQRASFVVSDPVFSSGNKLLEADTSVTATYTITASDLVDGSPLTVDVSSTGGLDVSPSTLTFAYTGSAVQKTITVAATDDTADESTIHSGTLTFAVSEGSNTTKYAGAIDSVSVDIVDNDGASGGSVTGTVAFWAQDSGGVTPNVVSQDFTATTSSASATVSTNASGQVDLTAYVGQVISLEASIGYASNVSGINISDAVTILKQIVGLTSLTGSAEIAADVNQDSVINIADAVLTLKTIVGLETSATLVAVDSSGSADLTVAGPTMDLTAVVLGDVDGSYADII
jgi:hypothetical protein